MKDITPAEALNKIEGEAFSRDKTWLCSILGNCQAKRFYGEVKLVFNNGLLKRIEPTQSLFPPHRGGEVSPDI